MVANIEVVKVDDKPESSYHYGRPRELRLDKKSKKRETLGVERT